MNKFIIVLVLALVACKPDFDLLAFQHFQKFIKKYNKRYESVNEFLARFEIFKNNIKTGFKGERRYKTGITKFSDLTRQEFAKAYLNYNPMGVANFRPAKVEVTNDAPDSWDWRDKGIVPPCQEPGGCDSSWALLTITNLECLIAIKKGTLVTLSVQMLIDCDYYDSGCNGGSPENAFKWLVENGGGLMTDVDYPYEGYQDICKYDSSYDINTRVTGYTLLPDPADENDMKELLYQNGPLIVALSSEDLMWYTGGVIDDSECSTQLDIFVLLIGYGTDDGDYWICQNHWGSSWGENGYFRIRRGKGTCGINRLVMTGTIS